MNEICSDVETVTENHSLRSIPVSIPVVYGGVPVLLGVLLKEAVGLNSSDNFSLITFNML